MDISQLIYDLFFDYTLRTVALGTAIIGIVSGSLGSFAFLRKQSLLGDAISHAALPGVVLAFMITRSKASFVLIIGALITGWLATLLFMTVTRYTRIKEDGALGMSLSIFFGFGIMLLTLTQRMADAGERVGELLLSRISSHASALTHQLSRISSHASALTHQLSPISVKGSIS
jgi:manganese/zinc/iron transport system permease protein